MFKKTTKPRGLNGGRKTKDGAQGLTRVNVTLDAQSLSAAEKLGGGNVSQGIRAALLGGIGKKQPD